MVVGLNPRQHMLGVPEFNYVANMHGNEVVGRELLLQLIDFLVEGYHSNSSSIKQLLSSTRIHFLPSMNPDGFDDANTHCLYNQGRFNHNGVDLNRNFPDLFSGHRQNQQTEPEVEAVMRWLRSETFILSANLHGGALVASYPYDNSNQGSELVGGASVTPDDDVFVHLAKVYADSHASMRHGNSCHHTVRFTDGITNGYEWYPLSGGLQDYSYIQAQCLDITLEVSCCKFPAEDQLPDLWNANKLPLISFIHQVHLGVKGRVLGSSGPVPGALVEVSDRKNLCPFTTNHIGEYYRLLLPGNYTFKVSFPGYQVAREMLYIPSNLDSYSALKHDFLLLLTLVLLDL
ncbi:Carboxypeptidase M [Merluccius polli]|uniref:Carboxypeptidase M n=1 Tax=Merluccius polli TaxID=89951 RepID=A0AA47P8C6_MERPO|nr:Carboxypeptidase M [Merluccius polli]